MNFESSKRFTVNSFFRHQNKRRQVYLNNIHWITKFRSDFILLAAVSNLSMMTLEQMTRAQNPIFVEFQSLKVFTLGNIYGLLVEPRANRTSELGYSRRVHLDMSLYLQHYHHSSNESMNCNHLDCRKIRLLCLKI